MLVRVTALEGTYGDVRREYWLNRANVVAIADNQNGPGCIVYCVGGYEYNLPESAEDAARIIAPAESSWIFGPR